MGSGDRIETFFVVGDSILRRMETKMRLKLILYMMVVAVLVMPATADRVDDLILELKHGELMRRAYVIDQLGEIGDSRSVDPLINALEDKSGEVCFAAAEALGAIGDPKAVNPLIDVLMDESKRYAQPAAARALGMIGDPMAVDSLIDVLNNEELWWVHGEAAWALGWIGVSDPRAISGLVNLTRTTDSNYEGRWYARCALAMLGESGVYESIIAGLRGDLQIPYYTDAQIDAVKALGKMGNQGQVDILRYTLQSDRSDTELRFWCAWALAMLGDSTGIRILMEAIDDDSVRYTNMERGRPYIRRSEQSSFYLVHGGDGWIRFNAVIALGEIGDERAIIPLMNMASSSNNYRVSAAAVESLEKIQG
ncbi:MAG: HEAT repeat domain-containing protein [Methanothrix sp.]|nr:HEAT repeat domain-containing protein [Methanothrix sp.]